MSSMMNIQRILTKRATIRSSSTLSSSSSSSSSTNGGFLKSILAASAAVVSSMLLLDRDDDSNNINNKTRSRDGTNEDVDYNQEQSLLLAERQQPNKPLLETSSSSSSISSSSYSLFSGVVESFISPLDMIAPTLFPSSSLFFDTEQNQKQSSTCLCEQAEDSSATVTPSGQVAALRKYRTLREMGRSATHVKLETKYDWDRNNRLGVGSYGSVYLATDRDNNENVALKEIPKKFTDSLNFQQEMIAMMYIKKHGGHPNLCTLHEHFDYHPDYYYIILDYIGGGELFDHLIKSGAYSELEASRLVREVASALSFLHGIGVVHGDLKPENVLLTTSRRGDSVVKLCDFGCTQIIKPLSSDNKEAVDDDEYEPAYGAPTPAYCPPETIKKERPLEAPTDMWGLGVILFIMLTGVHPYDTHGDLTDEEIEARIIDPNYKIPLNDKRLTGHLCPSAKDLISKLMEPDPTKRITAMEMLQHPWVRGETAKTSMMQGMDQRLSKYKQFKTKLQSFFFNKAINWSDDDLTGDDANPKGGRNSLLLRSFKYLDEKKKGYVTGGEIMGQGRGGPQVNLSDFTTLLSDSIKHRHFSAGDVVYNEGEPGHHMYIIDAGNIEVTTKDGSKAVRGPGEFFGEGSLVNPDQTRSATVRCQTPVHALEIDRENFEKYIVSNDSALLLTLKEKDKIRKRNRAKTVLGNQKNAKTVVRKEGQTYFAIGEPGKDVYILENGKVDVEIDSRPIFSAYPGNIFGEFSLFSGLPRNCNAVCKSPEGCIAKEIDAKTFRKIMKGSPHLSTALRELQLRREFKKAIVVRLGKEFPYDNPREAFAAADKSGMGILDRDSIVDLMNDLKNDYCDNEIDEIIRTLSLSDSGFVTYDEFKKVFIGNIKTAGAM